MDEQGSEDLRTALLRSRQLPRHLMRFHQFAIREKASCELPCRVAVRSTFIPSRSFPVLSNTFHGRILRAACLKPCEADPLSAYFFLLIMTNAMAMTAMMAMAMPT